jgi:hypothetical protein
MVASDRPIREANQDSKAARRMRNDRESFHHPFNGWL